MSNKIIFWETKTQVADAERMSLWKIVEGLGLEITTDRKKLYGIQLLFLHGGDKKKLVETKLDGYSENYVKEVANAWKIIYGGNQTVQENTNNEKQHVQYINLKDLSNRLIFILPRLQNERLSGELLEELLFDFDPKLETLLAPFATHRPNDSNLPVAKDSNGNKLKKNGKVLNIKDALSDYLGDKIAEGL